MTLSYQQFSSKFVSFLTIATSPKSFSVFSPLIFHIFSIKATMAKEGAIFDDIGFFDLRKYGVSKPIKAMLREDYKEPQKRMDLYEIVEKYRFGNKSFVESLAELDPEEGHADGFAYNSNIRLVRQRRKGVLKVVGPKEMYRFMLRKKVVRMDLEMASSVYLYYSDSIQDSGDTEPKSAIKRLMSDYWRYAGTKSMDLGWWNEDPKFDDSWKNIKRYPKPTSDRTKYYDYMMRIHKFFNM